MKPRVITRERVLELLNYDPETGIFTWKVNRGKVRAGTRAGCIKQYARGRYETVCLDYQQYLTHRLAFLIEHGYLPPMVDHASRETTDNRKIELRAATASLNAANSKLRDNNSSGHKGVCWDKSRNKWQARITVNYRFIFLGRYARREDAAAAYAAAAQRYFGEFARLE
jgi:AP2 domain